VFILVGIISFALAGLVRWWMMRTYTKWGAVPNKVGATGESVARHILDNNGLQHVRLEVSEGKLSDHYIPSQDLLRLSTEVNNTPSVAALAVAAHEVGHAMQDAQEYGPLKAKAVMMPLAAAASQFGMIMVLGAGVLGITILLNVGMLLLAGGVLMQLLTLPIEFDASKRALSEIKRLNLVEETEYKGAKTMLTAAAMTYVAGAASSVALGALMVMSVFRRPTR